MVRNLTPSLHPDFDAELTRAELGVLAYLRFGLSNKEIAAELQKSEPTIKNQVASILRKSGCPTRARLIAAVNHAPPTSLVR